MESTEVKAIEEGAEASQEGAKAIQEVAKTAAQYQSTIDTLGTFLGRLLAPAVEISALVADIVRGKRIELAMKLQYKVTALMNERGVTKIRPLPMATAYPLIEAATLEEDDEMADMFAHLVVSFIDADEDGYVPKQFVDTLRRLTPFEAVVLKKMSEAPADAMTESGLMYTASLPHGFPSAPTATDNEIKEPSKSIALALASLQQLGCVEGGMTWGGTTTFTQATVTYYGKAFLAACTHSAK